MRASQAQLTVRGGCSRGSPLPPGRDRKWVRQSLTPPVRQAATRNLHRGLLGRSFSVTFRVEGAAVEWSLVRTDPNGA